MGEWRESEREIVCSPGIIFACVWDGAGALQRQPVLISELLPVCDAESIKLKSGYLEIFISNFSMLCLLPF